MQNFNQQNEELFDLLVQSRRKLALIEKRLKGQSKLSRPDAHEAQILKFQLRTM